MGFQGSPDPLPFLLPLPPPLLLPPFLPSFLSSFFRLEVWQIGIFNRSLMVPFPQHFIVDVVIIIKTFKCYTVGEKINGEN